MNAFSRVVELTSAPQIDTPKPISDYHDGEEFGFEQSRPHDSRHNSPGPFFSAPDIETPDRTPFGDNSHQIIPASQDLHTTEHSQSNTCLRHMDASDETQLSGYSHQPEDLSPTSLVVNTSMPSCISDDNSHQLQAPKSLSNPALLQTTEEFQCKDYSLHHPAGEIFSSIDHPDVNHDKLHQPGKFISDPPGLDTIALFKCNDQSLVCYPELILSLPGINTLDGAESCDHHLHPSPGNLTALSTLHTVSHTQLGDDYLRQSMLHMPTPLPGTVGRPQFLDNFLYQFPEVISTSPVPDVTAQSESSDEEPEISPLQYARENGLCRDHLQTPYHASNLNAFAEYQNGLLGDSHLLQFKLCAEVNTDERLTASKDAALLIASVSREETFEWVDDTICQMITSSKYIVPRLELPLLKSDQETDCKTFARREGFEIKLQDVKLPLEMVDGESNGGIGFSPSLCNKGTEILEKLKKERLEVSKDTLLYLQSILRSDWTDENEKKVWESTYTYKKRRTLEPVTPPLSPMSFPVQPYEPSMSDQVFELPFLSDPESLTKQDLEAIEKEIFDKDVPTPIKNARCSYDTSSDTLVGNDTVKLADIYPPAASLDMPLISPGIETKRIKREDLKVEESLTPTKPVEPPKSVHFNDTIPEWPGGTGSPPTDPFESSYFEEAFGDAYVKATRMSEQESLIAADTTARVKVPDMDFSIPRPPWEAMQSIPKFSSLLDMQKDMIKDNIGKSIPTWPGARKVKVRYNPFPHTLAKVALEEDFVEDDSTWETIVKRPGDDEVIDTTALTWKLPGLRILRDEDNDDDNEMESGKFEKGVPQDLSFLAKKRKMEIEERGGEDLEIQDPPVESIANQSPRKKTPKPTDFMSAARKSQLGTAGIGGSLLMGEAFSVGNSVDNFLEIRGTKKPKLGDSSYFAKTSAKETAQPMQAKPQLQPELLMQFPIRNSPVLKANTPLPAPPSNVLNTPVNVVVASPFLKHRSLIKHIEALLPRIILIERDFSAHDTTVWIPGSVTRSPIASPLASEADIIVSPLVGIVITTLQKIKQKALPGQKTKPAIRERLERVSSRYERLIVLITEKREDEATRDLDDSDCNAFSEFVGFALSLETTVSIQFVGGGEVTLAKWLVNAIVQNRSEEELLAEETHWELFLRRAGLNAFAAQHIIGALKVTDSVNLSSPSKGAHFGLAAFVEMGWEQRIARFGPVCGNRLIARVGAVVDARWS